MHLQISFLPANLSVKGNGNSDTFKTNVYDPAIIYKTYCSS